MVKVVRKIPFYVQRARLRDYYINKEYQERDKLKYPNCIGRFDDCKGLKVGEAISDCKLCPHFCSKSYKKLCGGTTMEDEEEIKKVDKNKEREEKIKKMVENYEHLKPAVKAWLRIYANRGLVKQKDIERLGLEVTKNEV
ncbi:MAG: hypothetical protein ABH828_02130 [archaeon]